MSRILKIVAIIIVLSCIYSAISGESTTSSSSSSELITAVNVSTDSFATYYDNLNTEQKKLYDAEKVAVENGEYIFSVSTSRLSDDELYGALVSFWADHPAIFWLDLDKTEYDYQGNTYTVYLSNYTYFDYADISKAQKELNESLMEFVEKIKTSTNSKYEQALMAHDLLNAYAEYDYDALEAMESTNYEPSAEIIRTSYGALVNGKCVCVGYAVAYKLILDQLDIPCTVVLGNGVTSEGSEGHAWNKIQLDGEGYYVDPTWDNIDEGYDEYLFNREYFNSDISTFAKSHLEWTKSDLGIENEVSCKGIKNQFFIHENQVMYSFSTSEIDRIINEHQNDYLVQILFKNKDDLSAAEEAINNGSIDIKCTEGHAYANTDTGVLWIFR